MEKHLGLYIHVPFCLSKCHYCDFYSVKADDDAIKSYTDAVIRSIEKSPYRSRTVDTVYFGGGTPVLLGEKNLAFILETAAKYFSFTNPEVTLEANPAAVSAGALAELRKAGFNRVSFGVQSGNDRELKALGRLHTAFDAKQSILDAEQAGFSNISADLMLGIPRQTTESLDKTIDFIGSMPLTHISAYMLKIEDGTEFARRGMSIDCPDEDALAEMYLRCVDKLDSLEFAQYEVSNFAKGGAVSRHNLKYWNCGEYLGIGPSAHSFIDGNRFYIPRELKAFTCAENPLSLAVCDGGGGGFEEYAMLRLRLNEGLSLAETAEVFGVDTGYIAEKAKALERNRLVKFENGVVSLTPHGFLLSNTVTASLLY